MEGVADDIFAQFTQGVKTAIDVGTQVQQYRLTEAQARALRQTVAQNPSAPLPVVGQTTAQLPAQPVTVRQSSGGKLFDFSDPKTLIIIGIAVAGVIYFARGRRR